jgi:hypothetical protein
MLGQGRIPAPSVAARLVAPTPTPTNINQRMAPSLATKGSGDRAGASNSMATEEPSKLASNGASTPPEEHESMPVGVRHDGLGGFVAGAALLGCFTAPAPSALAAALLTPPLGPAAEYLKIADLRDKLEARESPFVLDNNAGGGFGAPGQCRSARCLLPRLASRRSRSRCTAPPPLPSLTPPPQTVTLPHPLLRSRLAARTCGCQDAKF